MLSAKFQMSGKSFPFSGQFNTEGMLSGSVVRPGLGALSITLQIDELTNAMSITGIVSSVSGSAQLVANRSVFSKTNSPPQAGSKYTIIFPGPPDSLTEPGGDGYGTAVIDGSGFISFSGKLADATAVSQKAFISRNGQWPLYISLYSGKGLIIGWLSFIDLPESDLGGTVAWLKQPRPFTSLYPSGFTIESDAVGSLYSFTNGIPVLPLNEGKGEVVLESGGLAQSITNSFVLDSANKVTSPEKLTLSIKTSSGLFSGAMIDPATGKSISFSGAVLQKQNRGAGFFGLSNETGRVIIEPQF
jgi:hypothetical protein